MFSWQIANAKLMTNRRLALIVATVVLLGDGHQRLRGATGTDWLQWGGPTRNFVSDAKGLATTWPPAGPRKLWSRPLGEGHSSILTENGRLYTMYRRQGQEEVVVALDAATGKTIWELKYPAPTAGLDFSQGAGPHSTPLIIGDRIGPTTG